MKKIYKIIFFIIVFSCLMAPFCLADTAFDVKLVCDSEQILKDQAEVVLYLKLSDYNKDGILGYEATLEYDNTVFESVTIDGINGWDTPDYDSTTHKFVSTTKVAKANTNIAKITLKINKETKAQNAEVKINELIISDGTDSSTLNLKKSFVVVANQANEDKKEEEKKDETIKDDINKDDNSIDQPKDDNKNNAVNNEKIENIIITPEEKKDGTTAISKIPQTGSVPIITGIVVISIIGIACYIRYRSIQIK